MSHGEIPGGRIGAGFSRMIVTTNAGSPARITSLGAKGGLVVTWMGPIAITSHRGCHAGSQRALGGGGGLLHGTRGCAHGYGTTGVACCTSHSRYSLPAFAS